MKIHQLQADAVRSAQRTEKVTGLTENQLETITAAGPEVDPERCAIHFYYPADSVE